MNILIGSNGGLSGVYLARRYRQIDGVTLFGADSSEDSVGRFFVDKQLKLPSATDENFIDVLIHTFNEEKIDIYIPTHSKETRVVAQYSEKINLNATARFLISPKETYDALENKAQGNINLREAGIPTPELIEGFDCDYPIFMKNDIGSGSVGALLIANERIHRAYKESYSGVSFYSVVRGHEYTVDCLFDQDGRLIGFNQRKRVKTNGGAVSITTNDNSLDILPYLEKIIEKWKFCGCVNFQYILESGTPYFIDINLRFPAGGLPLTVQSGFDIPYLIIKILNRERVESFKAKDDKLTMYRYYEEKFE